MHEPTSNASAIHIDGVTLRYRAPHGEVDALSRITLDVHAGEAIALVGPSGAGKSALLRVIAGQDRPTSGSVYVDGGPVRGPSPRRPMLTREPGLFPWATVEENVAAGRAAAALAPSDALVAEVLEAVGLASRSAALPHELDPAFAQRVQLARVLALEPGIVLVDEPLGASDVPGAVDVAALLEASLLRPFTLVFATHDLDAALAIADRVVVMSPRPGRVIDTVEVDLPHPRDPADDALLALRSLLASEIDIARRSLADHFEI